MTEPADAGWRALHVVMDGQPRRVERLLLDVVEPWATRAEQAGTLGEWYLIRPPRDLHTGGAQVKLRFRRIDDAHLAELRDRIDAFLHPEPGVPSQESVIERPLRAEAARFGGPEGMAAAVQRFPEATRVAIATMRRAPAGPARVAAAAELLLASVWAMLGDEDHATAVAWLRAYAGAQAGPGAVPPADLDRARAEAEAFHRQDQDWRGTAEAVRKAVEGREGPVGPWYRLMAGTWNSLVDLHTVGRLTMPPSAVFTNLIQMAHNRLGLLPQDNAYTAWLLAVSPAG